MICHQTFTRGLIVLHTVGLHKVISGHSGMGRVESGPGRGVGGALRMDRKSITPVVILGRLR